MCSRLNRREAAAQHTLNHYVRISGGRAAGMLLRGAAAAAAAAGGAGGGGGAMQVIVTGVLALAGSMWSQKCGLTIPSMSAACSTASMPGDDRHLCAHRCTC
jgi:hypothetical protein